MSLEVVWFVLIAVLWAGYFVLEGFDFGVGMLLPFLPRKRARARACMFESIGPVWDGNEVWLVVAAGATFAAFPAWYATMFSGFYLALLLVLVLLIVRVVSFEWREKGDEPALARGLAVRRTRSAASASPLLWGVALANLAPRRADRLERRLRGRLLATCSASTPSLAGVAVVALFAFHGAAFLTPAHDRRPARARRAGRPAARASRPPRSAPLFARLDRRRRRRPQRQGRLPARPARRRSRVVALVAAVAPRARAAAAAGRSR